MSKFNVGDKVTIRKDLTEEIGGVVGSMLRLKWQTVTIESADALGYRMKECNFTWSDEMLEPYPSSTLTIPYAGDKKAAHKALEKEIAKVGGAVNEVKEVERQAKVGEYIKVTKAWCNGECYNNGDILEVIPNLTQDHEAGCYAKTNKMHPCCVKHHPDTTCSFLSNREYVVLENYHPIPAVREVKRPAKVGEWIKIVNRSDCRYENGVIFNVESSNVNGGVFVKHPRGTMDGCAYICPFEYVVLENYTPPIEPVKQGAKATPDRIQKAKLLAKEILFEIYEKGHSVVFYVYPSVIKASLDLGFPCIHKEVLAKCSPNDEYNEWIGRAVALCKAVGRELPDWLVG